MKKINLALFTNILSMCKILHWSTYSHSKHLALDEAYDDFKDYFDSFVEVAIGIYGREACYTTSILNDIISEELMTVAVSKEFVKLNNELNKICGEFSQLTSILDDIKCTESQLLYRLTQTA